MAHVKIIQDPIIIKYNPNEEDLKACVAFGKEFGTKLLIQ